MPQPRFRGWGMFFMLSWVPVGGFYFQRFEFFYFCSPPKDVELMKRFKIKAKRREATGRQAAQKLRRMGFVPVEIYGSDENIHAYCFIGDIEKIVFTPETYLVEVVLDNQVIPTIIKEVQYHPLSDQPVHVDFQVVDDEKEITVWVPVRLVGTSVGQRKGGRLQQMTRRVKVRGKAKHVPAVIEVPIDHLDLGKVLRAEEIQLDHLELMTPADALIAKIAVPRTAKTATSS